MQTYLFFIFLITQCVKSAEVDCGDINPTSAADCKLSENDKNLFFPYKYCCYEKNLLTSKWGCQPYTETGFKLKDGECYNETNIPDTCEMINPKEASDCVLSESDKKKYDYCCYVVYDGDKECSAETKESYEASIELFKTLSTKEDIFECGINKTGFIFLGIQYLMILLLLIL